MEPASGILCGLPGFGAGIFTMLSLIEKPAWRLMWNRRSAKVSDGFLARVHRQGLCMTALTLVAQWWMIGQ